MKFCLYLFLVITIFFSCNSQHTKESISSTNLLVDNEISVYSLYSEITQKQMPWITHFKVRPFIASLFNRILQDKLDIYDPVFDDSIFKKLHKDTWLYILKNNKHLPFDTTQFNEIFFFENWHLDTNSSFNLQKNVIYWSPVKRENETLKLAGKIKCINAKHYNLLAQQLIYEFPLNDTLFQNERLNKKKLVKILLDWSIKNYKQTYNPFNAQFFTKKELLKRLNISDSLSYIPYHDVNSLLFVENWYYDTITYSIKKEILSIAPVAYIYDSTNISKQILFVLNLMNKPIKIF